MLVIVIIALLLSIAAIIITTVCVGFLALVGCMIFRKMENKPTE